MAEVPAVVEWNRGPLGPLAGHPLNDKRVRVDMGVVVTLGSSRGRFDVVLLDVDNGPAALPRRTMRGFTTTVDWPQLVRLSRPGGVLAVWSAREDRKFEQCLRYVGFSVEVERVRGLKKGGPRHTISGSQTFIDCYLNSYSRKAPRRSALLAGFVMVGA